jgi:16S rRNA (cytosine967-C5)-methyltransferase
LVKTTLVKLVGRVIEGSNREQPADALLREVLRGARGLTAAECREASRAVFSYYRWQGWLEGEKELPARIDRAVNLAEGFRKNPLSLPIDELRARTVPGWVADEVPISDEWLRSLQREPKLWLRARPGQGRTLANKLGDSHLFGTGPLADTLEYTGNRDLFRTPEFHAGELELQDISSQAVGLICSPLPGETWWDACAGGGGKTLHLSDLMQNRGLIWASDRAEWRLQKLKRRTARARVFNYRAAVWDGGSKLPTKTKFDGVLVDAPCSGTGTWQRNPHARWTTTLDDVKELGGLQQEILANTAPAVKPGGKLVYAVCTLARSETVRVAEAFEKQFGEFEPLPVANPLSAETAASRQLWIWPQDFGGNGMFIAAWRKRG